MDRRATLRSGGSLTPGKAPQADLSCRVHRRGRHVVVTVSGDLDAWSAEHLEAHLDDLINGQGNLSVVVDGGDLTFIDSRGLSVLIEASEQLRSRGGELQVERPSRSAARIFEIAGFGEMLVHPVTQEHRRM